MAGFTLVLLSLFFAPLYLRSRVPTLPDFLERRFNRHCRDWLTLVSIFSAVVIHIGVALYTAALVLRGILGIDPTATILGVEPLMFFIVVLAVLTGILYDGRRSVGRRVDGEHPDGALAHRRRVHHRSRLLPRGRLVRIVAHPGKLSPPARGGRRPEDPVQLVDGEFSFDDTGRGRSEQAALVRHPVGLSRHWHLVLVL